MRNRNATDRTNLRHYRTGDDGLDDLIEALRPPAVAPRTWT